ncbi:hypothetical protein CPC16_000886, partial [Podila verticillata]
MANFGVKSNDPRQPSNHPSTSRNPTAVNRTTDRHQDHRYKAISEMVHKPRNSLLTTGVSKYSRSQVFAKRALYKRKPTSSIAVCPAATTKTVEVK